MGLGADYSWARPGGAALAQVGVQAVGRYLASDGRGITAAEYQDLKAHGIGVWLVREGSAAGMLGGYAQGVTDGQIAVQQIADVGLPSDSVVHTAADWDVQSSQFPACDAYQDGFASALGGYHRVGVYGGLHWLNHAHATGRAVSFWKAGATSWDHGEAPQMPLNFVQTVLTPPLPGTDHNFINATTTLAGGSAATPIPAEVLKVLENGEMLLITSIGKLSPLLIGPVGSINITDQGEVDALTGTIGAKQVNDVQLLRIQAAVNRYAANAKLVITG